MACAVDDVPAYFTYEAENMIIVQSKFGAKMNKNDFIQIENFMSALISHESIHVVINNIENSNYSEALDNIEVILIRHGKKFQISLNNIFFANDESGIVLE